MKKIFLLFIAITLTTTVIAEPVPLQSQDVGNVGLPHKNPTILPTVDYTDGIITVQSTIPISDVTVIIRDEEGALLYTYYIYSFIGNHITYLPSSILCDMYSIELINTDFHLIGYF